MNADNILLEYERNLIKYDRLEKRITRLLWSLCESGSVEVHSIYGRVKDKESLKNKILNKGEKYQSISGITDIVGFRIISLYENEVELISKLIREEFNIDWYHSQDKKEILKADQFGYRSVHFVCELRASRIEEFNFSDIPNIKFEIQIRSVLQHSWAEIQHKLGYKSEYDIPDQVKRDFSRIAGLLELADMEFLRIKKNLEFYYDSIKINEGTEPILLNVVSLNKFLEESDILNGIEQEIAKRNNMPIKGKFRATQLLKVLRLLNIRNLKELNEVLLERKEFLIDFTAKWIEGQNLLRKGLSIWTLAYILKGEHQIDTLQKYLIDMQIGETQYLATTSERIINLIIELKFP